MEITWDELARVEAQIHGARGYADAYRRLLYHSARRVLEANGFVDLEESGEFPIDRAAAYDSHVDVPSMARKEEFEVKFIRRMTEDTLDITTTEGKQDFIRNLVAYNVILEGIWFYSGFMVALSFRQRNLLRWLLPAGISTKWRRSG